MFCRRRRPHGVPISLTICGKTTEGDKSDQSTAAHTLGARRPDSRRAKRNKNTGADEYMNAATRWSACAGESLPMRDTSATRNPVNGRYVSSNGIPALNQGNQPT